MARRAQAIGERDSRLFRWGSLRVLACLALPLIVAGCGTSGFSLESAVPDHSIVTGSVPKSSGAASAQVADSDQSTIRNAVSSAIVEGTAGDIGWANAQTGSRGTIVRIAERREGNRLCRRFTTSRESFEGIHLYRGETCLGAAGLWAMTAFDRVE